MACGQAVSLAVSLDGQDGREGVCLDGWLVVKLSAWLSGWMVRMVVRLSAW